MIRSAQTQGRGKQAVLLKEWSCKNHIAELCGVPSLWDRRNAQPLQQPDKTWTLDSV